MPISGNSYQLTRLRQGYAGERATEGCASLATIACPTDVLLMK